VLRRVRVRRQLTELDFKTITDASHYPTVLASTFYHKRLFSWSRRSHGRTAVTQVVHGTYHESWINIKRTGLSKMGRTHIHFAKGEYGSADVISGT
jgi:hypothetical protein